MWRTYWSKTGEAASQDIDQEDESGRHETNDIRSKNRDQILTKEAKAGKIDKLIWPK